MSNEPSNEPKFEPPPEPGGGSNLGGGNFLLANTTNHRRAIMVVATMLFVIFMNLIAYKNQLTFQGFIFYPLVGLAVFEFMFRTRNKLTLKMLPVYILIVSSTRTIIDGFLSSVLYGISWNPLMNLLSLFVGFPYNLYVLLDASMTTVLAYYLIKIYRNESWQIVESVSIPADVDVPPQSVTDLPSFLRRYRMQLIGFFGWFVFSASVWIPVRDGEEAFFLNICIFPPTILALIVLGFIKRTKGLALGILLALAVNFVLSLARGLLFNATCFIPFYLDLN